MTEAENKTGVGRVETEILALSLPSGGFRLEDGGVLPEVRVAYERYGDLTDARDNVVFICHALTGDAHVAGENTDAETPIGWWDNMIGPGRGIDTRFYHVICANILGGCKGTTGPSSINPATGKPYGSDFPHISVGDIVDVHRMLLKQLGIERLAVVVGGSFGGMQALEWSIRYPDEVSNAVVVASAAQLSPQALAFDIIGRRAITKDPAWQLGDYYEGPKPDHGLSQARRLAHVTYISHDMMRKKFGRDRRADWVNAEPEASAKAASHFWTSFQVESYLEYQGRKFTKRFDANSYLHITRAMDEYDLAERFGSLDEAFKSVQAKMLIVAMSGDWLFLPEQSMAMAVSLQRLGKRISFCKLDAPHGHDAFLTDVKHLSDVLHAFLPWIGAERPAPVYTVRKSDCDCHNRLQLLSSLIEPGAKNVLDLGCGEGELLSMLSKRGLHAVGVDIGLEPVLKAIANGDNVLLEDIQTALRSLPDGMYDCAVLGETLQVVMHPRLVLKEVLRVAKKAVLSFPNFGYYPIRSQLFLQGRMPKGSDLPFEWYETPNIHLFTLSDFRDLCREDNIRIESVTLSSCRFLARWMLKLGFKNLGAERVVARITK